MVSHAGLRDSSMADLHHKPHSRVSPKHAPNVLVLGGTTEAGALAWYSIRLVMQSHEFVDISTGLDATPLWIPQLGMAIGTSLFTLAFLMDLILLLSGKTLREASPDGEPAHIE